MINKKPSLSAKFIREQDEKLLKELEQLTKKKKDIKKFPDFGSSIDDAAQEVAEFSTDNSLIVKINQKIKEIKEARKLIAKGAYGLCQNCGERIMGGRLAIMPEAVTCSTCKPKKKK